MVDRAEGRRKPLRAGLLTTPCGPMIAVVDDRGALVRLDFLDHANMAPADGAASWHGLAIVRDDASVGHVGAQVGEYFAGRRSAFDVRLAPRGNAFLQRAWRALRDVPYGTTVSYGALAGRLRPPTSARAMGRANAVNPISIIVPCHRVIGADGRLTGYGGGLHRKAALLELEGAAVQPVQIALPLSGPVPAGART